MSFSGWKKKYQKRQNNSYAQARHKVTACGHSVASAAPEPAVSEPEEKVIPMLREQSKPWLEEAQKKMERQAEQMRRAGAMAKESIARIWERECLPMSSESTEPMRAYFQSRELIFRWNKVEQSDSMRFHPALPFYDKDGKKTGEHPAIVCAIRDEEGQLVTLHRIYLSPKGGKARVAEPKKMMPVLMTLRSPAVLSGWASRLKVSSVSLKVSKRHWRHTGHPRSQFGQQ